MLMNSALPKSKKLPPGSRFLVVGFIVSVLAAIAGLASLLTLAVTKVREGKGFETYRTTWLVEFSYVGVLVLFIAIVVAFLFGVALSRLLAWREERKWRAFEKKYESRAKSIPD